ncbi:DUF2225 domain-containing protein [Paenibacillus beijingensis]|uniref:DUF2225 domain-containing protein n=1 Tax=Paenibacillus beijingensis TaxID=1126833 RepID=A0A0D5NF70_9BACL|nr:DUF2225 domain-containing protein [Paenibacillus beijingensis]AJY73785.1 hypothetical protein VN24_02975 [Paenibacillus beijingensis]
MEPLYQTKVQCICCETEFVTSRVRPSFKRVIATDTDFCGYYNNANPDFYVVKVCPVCGFAFTENSQTFLNEKKKADYYRIIGRHWNGRSYGGERTLAKAMDCYKLALLSAQAVGEKARVIAGLLHHIAWLNRYGGNREQENRFLRFALEAYLLTYETEGTELNNAKLMYLIGELHRRLGENSEAVRWFSRVVNDKRIMDATMIRASRDQWQLIRAEMAGLEDASYLEAMPG